MIGEMPGLMNGNHVIWDKDDMLWDAKRALENEAMLSVLKGRMHDGSTSFGWNVVAGGSFLRGVNHTSLWQYGQIGGPKRRIKHISIGSFQYQRLIL